nr:matrix metalloproteinase-21-like isoform X2 [Styela clava]
MVRSKNNTSGRSLGLTSQRNMTTPNTQMDNSKQKERTAVPQTYGKNYVTDLTLPQKCRCELKNTSTQKRLNICQKRQNSHGRFTHSSMMASSVSITKNLFIVLVLVTSLLPCYVTSVPLDFNDIDESESESRGEIEERPTTAYTLEDVKLSAKEFLAKFGYVKPTEWNNVAPRFIEEIEYDVALLEEDESRGRKDLFEGSGIVETGDDKESHLITWSSEDISESQYQRALLKYQRINGLNITGELDNDTTSYMGRPRCGVPDRTAAIKTNRTDEFIQKLNDKTTTTVATTPTVAMTTEAPMMATTDTWINSTTGVWIVINSTKKTNNEDIESTTAGMGDGKIIIHAITTSAPDFESSGDFNEMTTTPLSYVEPDIDGSGDVSSPMILKTIPDNDNKDLSRKRRSAIAGDIQIEAGMEEVPFDASMDFDIDEIRTRQLGFKELVDGPISEAELPDESRVTALEGIFEALRKEKLSQLNATKRDEIFHDVVSSVRPPPASPVPSLVRRMVMETRTRMKRSNEYKKKYTKTNGWLMAFPKPVITWRLVEEWPTKRTFMISNEIWFTVKLAFRMWSEILPRSFREDNTSPMTNVDILLGFGKKVHNRCLVPFSDGPFAREYAHAWPLPQAEVHFNDDQPFVSVSWEPAKDISMSPPMTVHGTPISLLKVATHEIGHALGLPHKKDKNSVMNPVYTPYQSKKVVELEDVDRIAIQRVYGSCNLAFDAVFDWVRQYVAADGSLRWKYNTYFFKNTWFWLYENRGRRPRYGDPKYSSNFWRGVMDDKSTDRHRKVDGVVHIRDWSVPDGPIYFFTGDTFTEYDSVKDRAKITDKQGRRYPRKISEGFPGIPYPIDTVFYKMTERMLYFFKNSLVYKYDWRKSKVEGIYEISKEFPGWGGASPLPNNIDSAYYSYTDSAHYFFKGMFYWKMADGRERYYNKGLKIPENAVGPRRYISNKWFYLCDVDITEMQMTLPPE